MGFMKARSALFVSLGLALWAGAAVAEPGVPAKLSHDQILEIQTKLRALNYRLTVTGVMDDKTRSAIHRLLVENKEVAADFLTDEQLAKLRNTDISGFKYAAVAASPDGFHMAVWGRTDLDEAEAEVASACRRRSPHSSKCIVTTRSTGFSEGWVAAVHCTRSRGRMIDDHVEVATAMTREAAVGSAFEGGADAGFPRKSCRLTEVVEAAGRHKKK
jgi:hypothetical protein